MKNVALIFVLLLTYTLHAQVPGGIQYQSIVRDSEGKIVSEQNVSLRISLLKNSMSGEVVYSETHNATTNKYGLINLVLGAGVSTDDFSLIGWSAGKHFIKIELDVDGGSNYVTMGTTQLLTVPYAFYADSASYASKSGIADSAVNVFSGDYNDLKNVPVGSVNADNDSTNELQYLSLSNDTLYLSKGNYVKLPSGMTTPELAVSRIGDTLKLSTGGLGIHLPHDLSINYYPFENDGMVIGSSATDESSDIAGTLDGGYVVSGYVLGELTEHSGTQDILIAKFDANGDTVWTNVIGTWFQDTEGQVVQLADSSYIHLSSNWADGTIDGQFGRFDYWLHFIDKNGNEVSDRRYGGSGKDNVRGITKLNSSTDFMVYGFAESNDSLVKFNYGVQDVWILRLNQTGDTLWTAVLGGSNQEEVIKMIQTNDNNLVATVNTNSNDGMIKVNNGLYDAWITKINQTTGDTLWTQVYGGSLNDAANAVVELPDGSLMVLGRTNSADSIIASNNGGYDAWLLKLDASGNLLWNKTLGGSGFDEGVELITTSDGNLMALCNTQSSNGDLNGNLGGQDVWLIKFDYDGNILWKEVYGGLNNDTGAGIIEKKPGTFVISATSESSTKNVPQNYGGSDYWIFEVTP
ncbi:MAG: hypothetical protein MI922_01820 [Bacteroidales bacterium]|nr:hypothetical protein [Bacteroidales bacterium]